MSIASFSTKQQTCSPATISPTCLERPKTEINVMNARAQFITWPETRFEMKPCCSVTAGWVNKQLFDSASQQNTMTYNCIKLAGLVTRPADLEQQYDSFWLVYWVSASSRGRSCLWASYESWLPILMNNYTVYVRNCYAAAWGAALSWEVMIAHNMPSLYLVSLISPIFTNMKFKQTSGLYSLPIASSTSVCPPPWMDLPPPRDGFKGYGALCWSTADLVFPPIGGPAGSHRDICLISSCLRPSLSDSHTFFIRHIGLLSLSCSFLFVMLRQSWQCLSSLSLSPLSIFS